VIVGEVVAEILWIDNRRCSLPSVGSGPLGNESAVEGFKVIEFEFDLLKNPDTAFLRPELDSLDVIGGLRCRGVFGSCPLSGPAKDGGVGEVFNMSGPVLLIFSWKVGGWCESVGVRGSAASLLVSSSSSGIGLVISTGRVSGDEV